MYKCEQCSDRRALFIIGEEYAEAALCDACNIMCMKCSGRGFHVTSRGEYEYVVDCECKDIEKRIRLFNAAKIPALYADKLYEVIQTSPSYKVHQSQQAMQHKAIEWARAYQKGQTGFLIEGTFGTGKTMMLCQALSILTLELGVSCRYVDFSFVLQDIKQKIANKENGADSVTSTLRAVSVLAVDELGKIRGTDWELSELDLLISRRYQSSQTTLFATNFGEEELRTRIGGKLASRLKEKCEFLSIRGNDFRQQALVSKKNSKNVVKPSSLLLPSLQGPDEAKSE